MPAGSLHLYRFIEDAWSGGLRSWCLDSGGTESWILLENAGQARWLLRKFAAEGIGGVRVFDAGGFRGELARLAGIDPPALPATALFAVQAAASQEESGRVGAGEAGSLAAACDELARAGWHWNQLGVDAAVARRVHRVMDRTGLLPGFFDRRLREALPPQPARICCLGWDASHWPDVGLLGLAAAKFAVCELWIPSPRLPADALQREWIEALEQRLGLERVTCPESGFSSENEALVARLENSQLASRAEVRPPGLLVGREWPDQVALVRDQVLAWMPEAPIGIVAPEGSATAVAVAAALEQSGLRVERPGRMREPDGALLIIEQVARYHLGGHDIEEFIELARLLWLHQRDSSPALDPDTVRRALEDAFKAAQSRNVRILAQALPPRSDAAWLAVRKLVEALGRWDAELSWPSLREKWAALLSALELPAGAPAPLPRNLFDGERVRGRDFMEWLAARIAALRRDVAPADCAAPAPAVVTTFAHAAQQPWAHLIFLDANEHLWPASIVENRFLTDAARSRLNLTRKDSARLLTTRDLRLLEQARFLDLLEQCRGSIAFAGVLLEQSDAGDRAQPNEWVLRALIESVPEGLAPDLWASSARVSAPEPPPPLEEAERLHLETVHASRRNGTMPFDRYQFNFHETRLEPGAWPATDLDLAVIAPATFALKELFGAEACEAFARGEGAAVGTLAHRWLGRILGAFGELAPPGPAGGDDAKLARELAGARSELGEWFGAEELPIPIWWETCLRKTAWAARRCLGEVRRGLLDARYCSTEQKLAVTVRTPAGPVLLKGRIDILISDRPELAGSAVRMFDFKTGRGAPPTPGSLEKGSGNQFAAYYLMARDAGAAGAVIGIIKPEDRAREVFGSGDEEALRAHFGHFANLRRSLRFGRRGPLVSDYGVCETLPLATVPIDPAVLDQKAGLYLLAQ